MVNNYSKMRRGNVKIRQWLENQGFKNIHFFPHTRATKGFRAGEYEFDGMCYDNNQPRLVLFQCKASKKPNKLSKKDAIAYKCITNETGARCLWLNVVDRKKEVDAYE